MSWEPDTVSNPSEILPGLYLGTANDACYAGNTFDLVVNCTKYTHFWSLKDRVRIPVDDSPSDAFQLYKILRDTDVLDRIHHYLTFIPLESQQGQPSPKKVLVHCEMGQQRSPTVVACYLIKHHNMTIDEAIAFIRKSRNVAFYGGLNMKRTMHFLEEHLRLTQGMQIPGPSEILPGLYIGDVKDAATHVRDFEFLVNCTADRKVPEGCKASESLSIPDIPYDGEPIYQQLVKSNVLDVIHKLLSKPEGTRQACSSSAGIVTGPESGTVSSSSPGTTADADGDSSRREDNRKRVLVYCGAGEQRAPAVVGCYLIKFHKMTPDEAIQVIKKGHPIAFCHEARLIDTMYYMQDHCMGYDVYEGNNK